MHTDTKHLLAILLSILLVSSALSVVTKIKSQLIKTEFLSSILKIDNKNGIADSKVVEPLLENLLANHEFETSKDFLAQPSGSCWKIIWAPHIRILESFIFWNTFRCS
jgi:hypothetical protein